MNPSELAVQVYLTEKEPELGEFTWKVIRAKEINKIRCAQFRLGWGLFEMTPQEELFKEFYNHETANVVASMNDIELRAHREELHSIIFEGKARYTAANDELERRKKKGKVAGFETSLQTDQVSQDAINAIKTRSARMSKEEKLRQQMIELHVAAGESRADAEKLADQMMSARTIITRLKDPIDREKLLNKPAEPKTSEVFVSPFDEPKPIEPKTASEPVQSRIEAVIQEQAKPDSWNPFA